MTIINIFREIKGRNISMQEDQGVIKKRYSRTKKRPFESVNI